MITSMGQRKREIKPRAKLNQTHTEILTDCPYAHDIHDDFRVARTVEEDHGERLDQAVKKPGRK